MNQNRRRRIAVGLSLTLLAGAILPGMSLRAYADADMTDEEILTEYNRLMEIEAGDALDAFMLTLSEEQRATLLAAAGLEEADEEEDPVSELSWELSEEGVLTVTCEGSMQNFTEVEPAPWNDRKDEIKTVILKDGLTKVGNFAFSECTELTEVRMPEGLKFIGWAAFQDCTGLKKVLFSANLKTIGGNAFAGCTNLETVSLAENVKKIGYGAFRDCTRLNGISVPEDLEQIGVSAFSGCKALRRMNIPKNLQELGENAFAGCAALESVTVPATITEIPAGLFENCTGLSGVTLLEGVTEIGERVFAGCNHLQGVNLPKSLTAIGDSAFADCTNLLKASLPEQLQTLGADAYAGCTKLKAVGFGKALTAIGAGCFRDCTALKSVKLPETVEQVGDNAFNGSGVTLLEFSGDAPVFGENVFDNIKAEITDNVKVEIIVPCTAEGWTDELVISFGENIIRSVLHTGNEEKIEATEATCTEAGMSEGKKCSDCGAELTERTPIEALGHIPSEEDPGVCAVCGEAIADAAAEAPEAEAVEETVMPEETEEPSEPEETEAAPEETVAESASAETETAPEESKTSEPEETEATEPAAEEPEDTELEEEKPEEAPAQIVVESITGSAGNTVTVALSLENNPGLVSLSLNVKFDESVMKLVKVEDTGLLSGGEHKQALSAPYRLNWANDMLGDNITENGKIADLVFEIAEDAEKGNYSVTVSYDFENADIMNCNLETVSFEVADGSITVMNAQLGDVNGDGEVNSLDRVALTRYLAGWKDYAGTIDMAAADVNCDGKVNNLDRAILSRYLAGWEGYEELPVIDK